MSSDAEPRRFGGSFAFADPGEPKVPGELLLGADQVRLLAGGEGVGSWPRRDVTFEIAGDLVHMRVGDDSVAFAADDMVALREAIVRTGSSGLTPASPVPVSPAAAARPPEALPSAQPSSKPGTPSSVDSGYRSSVAWYQKKVVWLGALGALVLLIGMSAFAGDAPDNDALVDAETTETLAVETSSATSVTGATSTTQGASTTREARPTSTSDTASSFENDLLASDTLLLTGIRITSGSDRIFGGVTDNQILALATALCELADSSEDGTTMAIGMAIAAMDLPDSDLAAERGGALLGALSTMEWCPTSKANRIMEEAMSALASLG